MSDRAESIRDDARSITAVALELAIVDHHEPDDAAQRTHAITACLLAASEMAIGSGVGVDAVGDYMQSLLRVALAVRASELN